MHGTYKVAVRDRALLVVSSEVREQAKLDDGTPHSFRRASDLTCKARISRVPFVQAFTSNTPSRCARSRGSIDSTRTGSPDRISLHRASVAADNRAIASSV